MTRFKFVGPPLSAGPLPAIFYFALSADESLNSDPFNQPVAYLSTLYPNYLKNRDFDQEAPQDFCLERMTIAGRQGMSEDKNPGVKPTQSKTDPSSSLGIPMRIFSIDLPGHGKDLPATKALEIWASEIKRGHNLIQECIDQVERMVEDLLQQNILIPDKIATMGLSRGAFIATLAAAQIPHVQSILGFAPLIRVSSIKEFQTLESSPLIESLNLELFIEKLGIRPLRFYIGNVDARVGTRNCFNFIENLSLNQLEKKVRSPQVELIISPSIGFQGHGTSKAIFHQGAHWIAQQLGCIDGA